MITHAEPQVSAVAPVSAKTPLMSERLIVVLLFAGTFLYLLAFRRVTNMDPDEGIVLQGAERILHGQLPYRDFFSFYTPGSFYITAKVLKIFGDSLPVARTLLVFMGAVFPVITYVLARRTCSRQISLFVAILVAITSAPYRFLVLHNWDSTFWACLSVYCAVRWLETARGAFAFATGTFVSFTFLSEQSKGAGLCLGIVLAVVIFASFGRKLFALPALIVGFVWPIAATITYFAAKHALRPMLQDLLWPLQHYSVANRVRYGDQNWSDHARDVIFRSGPFAMRTLKAIAVSPGFLVPVLPIIAIVLLFYWTRRLRLTSSDKSAHYVLLTCLLAGLLASVVVVRADIIHFMYLAPLFYLVLAWLIDARGIPIRMLNAVRVYSCSYVAVAFGLMAIALFVAAVGARNRIETRRGIVFTREPDSVLEYAMTRTAPGEKIFVYPYLPLYYYLTATESPSKYEYFQPGMSTSEQEKEILDSLESGKVSTVFWEPEFANKIAASWPGTAASAIARDPIGEYIARNYSLCHVARSAAGWDFLILRRGGLPCY